MKTSSLKRAVLGSNPGVRVVTDGIDGYVEIEAARPYLKLVVLGGGGHGPMAAEVPGHILRPEAPLSGDHVAHANAASYPEMTRSTSTPIHVGEQ